MSKTRRELVTKALFLLGVGSVGQAATADDFNAVDDEVDPFIEQIYGRDGILVQDDEAIEDGWFLPLATMLAARMINDFALGPQEGADLSVRASQALIDLKVIVANQPVNEILRIKDLRW